MEQSVAFDEADEADAAALSVDELTLRRSEALNIVHDFLIVMDA